MWSQDGWTLASFFMDRDEVHVHKLAKISSHLDQTNLVNKGFISQDTADSHEQARWLHLALFGSRSHHTIWFTFPARGACHIIRENNVHRNKTGCQETRFSSLPLRYSVSSTSVAVIFIHRYKFSNWPH